MQEEVILIVLCSLVRPNQHHLLLLCVLLGLHRHHSHSAFIRAGRRSLRTRSSLLRQRVEHLVVAHVLQAGVPASLEPL